MSLPTRRKLGFALTLSVIAYVTLELFSYAAFAVLYRDGHRPSVIFRDPEPATDVGAVEMPAEARAAEIVVHPYLGFAKKQGDASYLDRLSHPPKRSPDKVIVGVLGGSVAHYMIRDSLESLVAALSKAPRFAGKKIQVISGATIAYKQPQQLFAFAYMQLLGYEFDYLVNLDGFNEIAAYAYRQKETGTHFLYPQFWDHVVREAYVPEYLALLGKRSLLNEAKVQLSRGLVAGPLRYSVTAQLVRRRVIDWLERIIGDSERAAQAAGEQVAGYLGRGPAQPGLSLAQGPAMFARLADVWEYGSTRLQSLATANGVRYHHFLQPNLYVPGSKPLSAAEKALQIPGTSAALAVPPGYEALLQRVPGLQAGRICFHDLSMLFAKIEATLYVDSCCHVNKRGSDLIATAIAETLGGGDCGFAAPSP